MAHLSILDKDNNLLPKKIWEYHIKKICSRFEELILDEIKARTNIKEALISAVLKRKSDNIGVLFSGGLDSTLIAKILKDNNIDFKCICVTFENSSDMHYAKKAKEIFGFNLDIKTISQQDLIEYLPTIVNIVGDTDVVKIEVAVVVYFGLLEARNLSIKNIFAGGGSEEIFCGYQRHLESHKKGLKQLYLDSISGLVSMYDRDLMRDFRLARYFKINLLLPFLDKEVIKEAMSISPSLKTDGINKKIILRNLALEEFGLGEFFSRRKRTAAQYGSKISSELSKLAKKSGHKTKLEFLKSITK